MKLSAVGEGMKSKKIKLVLYFGLGDGKRKGNIHLTYDCIHIATISTVGECSE
jgi:hypothetical protein